MPTASTPTDPQYRREALEYYGSYCQECGWSPESEAEAHKLHVPVDDVRSITAPYRVANLTILCRDCHLSRRSESAFSHEVVGTLTNTLESALTHKRDGFSDRVARRVRLDSVKLVSGTPVQINGVDTPTEAVVEGLNEGDHYDAYYINTDADYLQMCSCYRHAFGVSRARNICTHVGAVIVRQALERMREESYEAALQFVQDVGSDLNTDAKQYIKQQEIVEDGIDTLDIEDRFSETWAKRASAQAKKMTKYDAEYKCFGSECEGCEIRLTADGYTCTDAKNKGWEKKFPCPGKLGAYILDETGDSRLRLTIDTGHLFTLNRPHDALDCPVPSTLAVTERTETDVTFTILDTETNVTLPTGAVIDAITSKTFTTTTESKATPEGFIMKTTSKGIPTGFAPKLDEGDLYRVTNTTLTGFDIGDVFQIREYDPDSETETIQVETLSPDTPFGGPVTQLDINELSTAIRKEHVQLTYASHVFDIIATETAYGYGKLKVGFSTPHEAKEDIKSLDWDRTKRYWNDPIDNKWSMNGDEIEYVVEHLRDNGWAVWVPEDIREELTEAGLL
jgi:hypothetical protein